MTYEDIENYVWEHMEEYGLTDEELADMTVEEFRKRILQGGIDGTEQLQGVYEPDDPRIDYLVAAIFEQQQELWESASGLWLAKWGVAEIEVTRKDGRKYSLFHDTETGKHIKTKDVGAVRKEKAGRKYQSEFAKRKARVEEERGYKA